jgi:L-iditol 2-dehydrogenase
MAQQRVTGGWVVRAECRMLLSSAGRDLSGGGGMMRVVACTADGGLRVEQRSVPAPGPGEIRLALRCCGVCGTDLFKLAHRTVAAGTVLGHELVGSVEACGSGLEGLAVGDRVVVTHHRACGTCALCRRGADSQCPTFRANLLEPGGYAELLVARPPATAHAWRVPEQVSDDAASFLEPAACVLRGVDRAGPLPADGCALILGGGSMGLLHLLVLRALQPGLAVVVCDPLAERRALALELGAAAASSPAPAELGRAVRGLSAGLGADAVFDTVGGSGPLAAGLQLARPGGSVVLFAHAAAGEAAGFELNPFFRSEQRVVATYSCGTSEQRRIAALLATGALDPAPLVSHRLPFSRCLEAVALAVARRALKILLLPDRP